MPDSNIDEEGKEIKKYLSKKEYTIALAIEGKEITSTELAEKIGITQANLSILKTNKGKAIRFSTLDAICKALNCTPGDILEYRED